MVGGGINDNLDKVIYIGKSDGDDPSVEGWQTDSSFGAMPKGLKSQRYYDMVKRLQKKSQGKIDGVQKVLPTVSGEVSGGRTSYGKPYQI